MTITEPSPWLRTGEEAPVLPPSGATEWAVAEYLDQVMLSGYELTSHEVIGFCRIEGHLDRPEFNLVKVAQCLRHLAVKNLRTTLGDIPQDKRKWAWLDRPEYVRRCPRHMWFVDKRTGEVWDFFDDCNSRLCSRRCGLARAESDLLWACRRLRRVDRVWYAVVPNDDNVLDRIKKRHERHNRGGGLLWVRRSDIELVYVLATSDLSGRAEPRNGEWLSCRVALRLLASDLLALPGVDKVTFSGVWRRPSRAKKEARWVRLGEGPDEVMEAAMDRAEQQLKEQHGIWRKDLTPEQVEALWLPLLEQAVEAQWQVRRFPDGEEN
jgi:hypothetical protein